VRLVTFLIAFVRLLISRTTLIPSYYRTTKEDKSLTQDCVKDGYYQGYFSLRVHLLVYVTAYVSYLTVGSDSEQRRIGRLIFRLMFLASSGSTADAAWLLPRHWRPKPTSCNRGATQVSRSTSSGPCQKVMTSGRMGLASKAVSSEACPWLDPR
jgi:hypothetical protein